MSSHAIPEWCSNLVPFVHNRGMWVGSSFGQLKGHSHTDFHYCSKVSQQSFEGSGPFVPTTPWRCSTNAVLVNAWDCICNEVEEQGKGLVLSWTSLLWFGVPLHPDIHYGCGQDMVCLYLSRHRGGYVFLPFGLPSGFHVHQFQASQSIIPRVCILMSWTVFFPDGGRPLYSGPSFDRDSHRWLHRAAATSQIRSHVSPWWYGGLVNTPFCEDAANWLSLETVAFQLTGCFILYRQSLLSATKQGSYQRCDGSTRWSHLEGVPNSNSEGPLLGGKSTSTTTAFIGRFRYFLEAGLLQVMQWLWIQLQFMGCICQQCAISMAGICLVYCCRLLLYACRLKGGRCNCDNILQGARGVTAWVPFALGLSLKSFTGLNGFQTMRIPSRQRDVSSCYSRDLWLLLFILSLLLTGTDAAHGHASHGAPGMHTPYGDEAPWTGRGPGIGDPAILEVHDVAAEIPPPPPPPSSSDESGESSSQDDDEDNEIDLQPILFRVFGYGYPGEHIALGFIPGPTMDYAIRQLYADSVIAQSSSPGRFIPLQAEPITEACHAMWLPHWAVHATGKLVVIDLEQVSHGSFVHFFESRVINLEEVKIALSHIWRQGWEVFVPSHGNLPLESDMQVTIDHGTTIYIYSG